MAATANATESALKVAAAALRRSLRAALPGGFRFSQARNMMFA